MSVVVGLLAGVVTARFLVVTGNALLHHRALARRNFRGWTVPTAGGIVIVLAVLVVEAGRAVFGALGVGAEPGLTVARSEMLFAAFGFGLLGLLDDVLGGDDSTDGGIDAQGFRGHVGALLRGRLTTGLVKLVGGAGVAVVLVAAPGFATGRRLLVDAVLIALAANLGNLLDRAPGRVLKGALVVYVPLALTVGTDPVGVALAPLIGAAIGLFPDDLRERLMLGDTGANVVGAALGLGVVLGTSSTTRTGVLWTLIALNVAAELVSFSAVIDRVGPLRAFDRLGRRP